MGKTKPYCRRMHMGSLKLEEAGNDHHQSKSSSGGRGEEDVDQVGRQQEFGRTDNIPAPPA